MALFVYFICEIGALDKESLFVEISSEKAVNLHKIAMAAPKSRPTHKFTTITPVIINMAMYDFFNQPTAACSLIWLAYCHTFANYSLNAASGTYAASALYHKLFA